jgi:hypothetical protein
VQRAILAKAGIKPKEIEPEPVPRWLQLRRERNRARKETR